MIKVRDAIRIHEILIENFGGTKGIRDLGLLESALSRPFQTFDQKELYPNPTEKAADISATEDEKYDFVMSIADGSVKYPKILEWIKNKIK